MAALRYPCYKTLFDEGNVDETKKCLSYDMKQIILEVAHGHPEKAAEIANGILVSMEYIDLSEWPQVARVEK